MGNESQTCAEASFTFCSTGEDRLIAQDAHKGTDGSYTTASQESRNACGDRAKTRVSLNFCALTFITRSSQSKVQRLLKGRLYEAISRLDLPHGKSTRTRHKDAQAGRCVLFLEQDNFSD